MITRKDKDFLIKAFEGIDVKKLEIDHPDRRLVKWFRFGSDTGLRIAAQIINDMPERKKKVEDGHEKVKQIRDN